MSGVIITAPHAFCFEKREDKHSCDYISKQCAKLIYKNIDTENKFLRINTLRRSEMDMNRDPSRNSDFRKHVRNLFQDASFLFDIHSFPRMNQMPFMNDVYLLDDSEPSSELTNDLHSYLNSKGYKCNKYKGKKNDITSEARDHNLEATLIEINEDLDIDKMYALCIDISDFINSLNE